MTCTSCPGSGGGSGSDSCPEWMVFSTKTLSVVALLYLLYVSITCPCRPAVGSCHLTSQYVALAVVVGVLVFYNGSRVKSWLPDV